MDVKVKSAIVIFITILFIGSLSTSLAFRIYDRSQTLPYQYLETELQDHFNNWQGDEYKDWVCRNKAGACYDYLTEEGYEVIELFGFRNDTAKHVWLLIKLNNAWYEFECNDLIFYNTSNRYEYVTSGILYKDEEGVKEYDF